MLKLARRARGHFMTLIEIRVHLIRCKPGRISHFAKHLCLYTVGNVWFLMCVHEWILAASRRVQDQISFCRWINKHVSPHYELLKVTKKKIIDDHFAFNFLPVEGVRQHFLLDEVRARYHPGRLVGDPKTMLRLLKRGLYF